MKTSKKTKKLLGGVAIAAVSLGCLGLAGIANAATDSTTSTGTSSTGTSSTGTTSTSAAYQLGSLSDAMTGTQKITISISAAQGTNLANHTLEYFKIGDYMGHGTPSTTNPASFSVSAASQDIENVLYGFLTAPKGDGGLTTAFPNASYAASDGEAFNWMLTQNNNGTYLGADASGQAGYGTSENTDYAVRLLANYLYTNEGKLGVTAGSISTSGASTAKDGNGDDYQEVTWQAPSPGIYLIVDTSNNNQSLPIILPTMPSSGYSIPTSMADFMTDQIALKTQDPQAVPIKQFVTDITAPASGDDLTTGTLSDTDTASIGSGNAVTYQVSNVFPNTNGYLSYTYNFIDYPGNGLTLAINGGQNMYVAGIPLSTLVSDGDATITTVYGGTTTTYGTASGDTALSSLKDLVGSDGNGSELKVSIDEAGMQYIQNNGYQTSNVSGNKINFAKLTSNTDPANAPDGSANTMAGANGGATSYTGQTQAAGKDGSADANSNKTSYTDSSTKATVQTPQATGELFGLTYQGYLNNSVTTSMTNGQPATSASNTAETQNNGSSPVSSSSVPLTTSGSYNGTGTNGSGKDQGTTQVNPGSVTNNNQGIPTNQSAGAGLNWMKIWSNGQVAKDATFIVSRPSSAPGNTSGATQYLYATGTGWGWTTTEADAQHIAAVTSLDSSANQAALGGLYEISGLASGVTYTVSEYSGAQYTNSKGQTTYTTVLPTFTITLNSNGTETVDGSGTGAYNLVNNTPGGNPFFSGMKGTTAGYNTVENVKSLSGLPLTGGAGILTGVIAAVLLFGTAGIILVVYKRRKNQQED